MKYYIRIDQSLEMGREVRANVLLPRGLVIENCELLVLSPDDTIKVNETDLKYYTFKYTDKQDCLVLGIGEIFNHDVIPNVSYSIISQHGRDMMQFKALRDISIGEQLFIDYTSDVNVDSSEYINKNLI